MAGCHCAGANCSSILAVSYSGYDRGIMQCKGSLMSVSLLGTHKCSDSLLLKVAFAHGDHVPLYLKVDLFGLDSVGATDCSLSDKKGQLCVMSWR